MKEIDAEIAQKKMDNNVITNKEKMDNYTDKNIHDDNTYYSWRKRKDFEARVAHNRKTHKSYSQNNLKRQESNIKNDNKHQTITNLRNSSQVAANARRAKTLKSRFEGGKRPSQERRE